ncbi:MAG: rod-binding protein [Treponema sp.]|jgi:flagellar protein FlgJ|nr:rod-binding protein [Treponema sp.]
MDVTAIGSAYLQNSRLVPFQALSAPAPGKSSASPEDFAGLLGKAKAQTKIDKTDKLYEQCEALETFMLKILVKGMRGTVMKSDLTDTGFAGEMYEDMLYDEYTTELSKNTDFGLAELAYLDLTGQRGHLLKR